MTEKIFFLRSAFQKQGQCLIGACGIWENTVNFKGYRTLENSASEVTSGGMIEFITIYLWTPNIIWIDEQTLDR